jgi:hypothetical protein
LQACEPKSVQYINKVVDQQLNHAQNNELTKLKALDKSTGVLDRLSSDAITVMLEYNDDLRGKGISPETQKRPPREIPGLMQTERDELALAARVKNPLLELKGQERSTVSTFHV